MSCFLLSWSFSEYFGNFIWSTMSVGSSVQPFHIQLNVTHMALKVKAKDSWHFEDVQFLYNDQYLKVFWLFKTNSWDSKTLVLFCTYLSHISMYPALLSTWMPLIWKLGLTSFSCFLIVGLNCAEATKILPPYFRSVEEARSKIKPDSFLVECSNFMIDMTQNQRTCHMHRESERVTVHTSSFKEMQIMSRLNLLQ